MKCGIDRASLRQVALLIGNFEGFHNGGLEFGLLLLGQALLPFPNIISFSIEILFEFLFGDLSLFLHIVGCFQFTGNLECAAQRFLPVAVVDSLVEEGEELVVFALFDRIELMVVALSAANGESEKSSGGGVDAVDDRFNAELFGIDAAFLVDLGVAMETSGNLLPDGRLRKQIAGELPDGKLVERQVLIERADYPVAVLPNRTRRVDGIAVRVRVTGRVQPPSAPAFAVMGRGQQLVHQPLVSVGPLVLQKRRDFGDGWRKTDEIEGQAPD